MKTFPNICDVHMVADDIIIASETEAAHDATLLKVMKRAQEKGVKFNKKKIQFKAVEVNYLGNIITPEGIKPDPKKIPAIENMPTPHDCQSLLHGKVPLTIHTTPVNHHSTNESTSTQRCRLAMGA